MSLSQGNDAPRIQKTWVPTTLTLARWQLRRTWKLLLIVGIGVLASVILVCVAPLYSNVAMTAGLRDVLTTSWQNSTVEVTGQTSMLKAHDMQDVNDRVAQHFQSTIAPYVSSSQFSVQTDLLPLLVPQPGNPTSFQVTPNQDLIRLISYPMEQTAQHLTLLRGHLPQVSNNSLEVALTAETANFLHVDVGSILATQTTVVYEPVISDEHTMPVHVVGIFAQPASNDSYWHSTNFLSTLKDPDHSEARIYTGLVSSTTFLSVFDKLWSTPTSYDTSLVTLNLPVHLSWFYTLDPLKMNINNLVTVTNALNNFQVANANDANLNRPLIFEKMQTSAPTDALNQYNNEINVAIIPSMGFVLIIFCLLLYFVGLMADLLVERHASALSILRSRGASRRQIFGALMLQCCAVGMAALLIGPWLALVIVQMTTDALLPQQNLTALNIITDDRLRAVLSVGWYALVTVVVVVGAMLVAVNHTTSQDVLSMRREAARATRRPLWQRLNLDIFAVVVVVIGYVVSTYITGSNILDPQLRLLLLSPLVLTRTAFTILAAILLFLRFFPVLLNLGSSLSMRNPGAAPMIALAQMSRAPRQTLRLTLLLSLATAFTIFSIVFYASQTQRAADVAAYQTGADFSGQPLTAITPDQIKARTAAYNHIHGMRSTTLGFVTTGLQAGDNLDITANLMAVDADTYAQTAAWPSNNSPQALDALMKQVAFNPNTAKRDALLPALVDSSLWDALHLAQGKSFILRDPNFTGVVNDISFIAVAEVQHIPTLRISGGVLVDVRNYFQKLNTMIAPGAGVGYTLNRGWFRSEDDPVLVANVRHELLQGSYPLLALEDRRTMIDTLHQEPLYLNLIGILALGPITVLLLALMGNLIASWLSAQDRLSNFALLRALGAAPRNIAGTLTWEQAIIYTTSMVLGVLFGAFLSFMVVPALLFTSVTGADVNSEEFYLAQNIPPIQVIVPALVGIALALLVGICIVVLGMMVRVVSRPAIAQTLRLNED